MERTFCIHTITDWAARARAGARQRAGAVQSDSPLRPHAAMYAVASRRTCTSAWLLYLAAACVCSFALASLAEAPAVSGVVRVSILGTDGPSCGRDGAPACRTLHGGVQSATAASQGAPPDTPFTVLLDAAGQDWNVTAETPIDMSVLNGGSLTIAGAAASTRLQCGGRGMRALHATIAGTVPVDSISLSFANLTFLNCGGKSGQAAAGGAIFVDLDGARAASSGRAAAISIAVNQSTFTGNQFHVGGAVAVRLPAQGVGAVSIGIERSIFSNNLAAKVGAERLSLIGGGAVAVFSTNNVAGGMGDSMALDISRCTFADNSAVSPCNSIGFVETPAAGGGVLVGRPAGAHWLESTAIKVTASVFTGCTAVCNDVCSVNYVDVGNATVGGAMALVSDTGLENTSLVVRTSSLSSSTADVGGAIGVLTRNSSSLIRNSVIRVVENTQISDNKASTIGGGLGVVVNEGFFSNSSVQLQDTTLRRNIVYLTSVGPLAPSRGGGAAVISLGFYRHEGQDPNVAKVDPEVDPLLEITSCVVVENSANHGGGLAVERLAGTSHAVRVSNSTFEYNFADAGNGGAILVLNRPDKPVRGSREMWCTHGGYGIEQRGEYKQWQPNTIWSVETSVFRDNVCTETDGSGGAIAFLNGSNVVVGSEFANNTASSRGGAVYVGPGSASIELDTCRFSSNGALLGQAVNVESANTVTMRATGINMTVDASSPSADIPEAPHLQINSGAGQLVFEGSVLACGDGKDVITVPVLDTRGTREPLTKPLVGFANYSGKLSRHAWSPTWPSICPPLVSSLAIVCLRCGPAEYSLNAGTLAFTGDNGAVGAAAGCTACPLGGDCSQPGAPKALPGFWGAVVNATATEGLPTNSSKELRFQPCPDGYCCAASGLQNSCAPFSYCANNRAGPLCGECLEGYSQAVLWPGCVADSACDAAVWFFPLAGFLALVGVVGLLTWERATLSRTGLTKAGTYFFQLVPLVLWSTTDPGSFLRMSALVLSNLFNLQPPASYGPDSPTCPIVGLSSTGGIVFDMFGPVLVAAVMITLQAGWAVMGIAGCHRAKRALLCRRYAEAEVYSADHRTRPSLAGSEMSAVYDTDLSVEDAIHAEARYGPESSDRSLATPIDEDSLRESSDIFGELNSSGSPRDWRAESTGTLHIADAPLLSSLRALQARERRKGDAAMIRQAASLLDKQAAEIATLRRLLGKPLLVHQNTSLHRALHRVKHGDACFPVAWVNLMLLAYGPVLLSLFKLLHCVEVYGQPSGLYRFRAAHHRCYKSLGEAGAFLLALCMATAPVWLAYAKRLVIAYSPGSSSTAGVVALLEGPYGPTPLARNWEAVMMLIRLAFVSAYVFVDSAVSRALLLCLVAAVSAFLTAWIRPYRHGYANAVQVALFSALWGIALLNVPATAIVSAARVAGSQSNVLNQYGVRRAGAFHACQVALVGVPIYALLLGRVLRVIRWCWRRKSDAATALYSVCCCVRTSAPHRAERDGGPSRLPPELRKSHSAIDADRRVRMPTARPDLPRRAQSSGTARLAARDASSGDLHRPLLLVAEDG